ncbi:MAG: hypothetical protein U1F43_38920 [Myxococcota bacterium]
MRTAAAAHGEARVATALVLVLLAKKAGDRRGEWAAAAAKATAFLQRLGDSAFDAVTLVP